ncbi:unnamed protein product [Ixodes hexagonus]
MAVKWVKKNAARFGGNADKETLMGRFTGSMSASIHLASLIKERLYEKVVLQSSIAVGDYVFDSAPLHATSKLAHAVGCHRDSVAEVVSCLQQDPAAELLNNSLRNGLSLRRIFDGELIVEEPMAAVKKSRHQSLDVIIGTNQYEGLLCLLTLQYLQSEFYHRLLKDQLTAEDLEEIIRYHAHDFTKKQQEVLAKLVLHGYRYQPAKEGVRSQYLYFCGDMYIASQAEQMARLLSQHKRGSLYLYQFAHRPSFSAHPHFLGAAHGDDVLFAMGLC